MKKLLFCLTVALILSLSLFSCGGGEVCDSCTDSDGDRLCDVCGSDMPNLQDDLPLFVDGEPTFNIVMADDASPEMKTAVRSFQNVLSRKLGVSVTVALESKSTEADVEVLVGNVRSRGTEYTVEEHTLGSEGYVIKLIGTKVVINGGSPESQLLLRFTVIATVAAPAVNLVSRAVKDQHNVPVPSLNAISRDFDFRCAGTDFLFTECGKSILIKLDRRAVTVGGNLENLSVRSRAVVDNKLCTAPVNVCLYRCG